MTEETTQTPAPAAPAPAPTPPAPSGVEAAPAAPAPVKPDGLDDRFFDATAGVKWADLNKEFADLAAFKAETEAARKSVPEKLEDYKLEFEDGALPEGFELNPDDARWQTARELAKELGVDQNGFAKLASAHIKLMAAEETAMQGQLVELQKAEAAKLGPNAAAISDAVTQWVNSAFEPEAAKVLGASNILVNASVVKSLNKVITALANAGVTFNADGRAAEGKVPSNFSSWSFAQQRAWQHANGVRS